MNKELLKYFTSPTAAAEFALLHTDGETRQNLLGVTRLHYTDKKLAEKWFMQPTFNILSYEAEQQLEEMRNEMIAR